MSRRRISRGRGDRLPPTLRGPAERREYVASFVLVALLQAAIAVSLAVCAMQTYRMWRQGVAYVPGEIGRVIPAVLLLGAGLAAAAGVRTIGRIRAVRRIPMDRGPAE